MKDNKIFSRRIFGIALLSLLAMTVAVPLISLAKPHIDWRILVAILYVVTLIFLFGILLVMHQNNAFLIPGKLIAIYLLLFVLLYPISNRIIYDYFNLRREALAGPLSWAASFPHGVAIIIVAYNYIINRNEAKNNKE